MLSSRLAVLVAAALPPCGALLAAAPSRPVDFARDVRPVLTARCIACHGPAQQKGGLRLDRAADALRGGDSGPAIVPGKPDQSLLLKLVTGANPQKVMPPTGKGLTPAEVTLLRKWIDQGAPFPGQSEIAPTGARMGGNRQSGIQHWSFTPPRPAPLPRVKHTAWARNPVDLFVLERLERERLKPSPEADRPTLIRRLYLDLLGLLPSPAQVEEFTGDRSPDAYEKLVDRVLASPHFGERWGRHWLDLARYADSDGYEKDLPRPYAYLYRDWVINAVNADMPFDRFTVEQLAGDLLPNATLAQRTATGFHRNTLKNREGGIDPEEDRVKATVDRTNTTATVWLGLTLGCAECHTHKYDRITHREYYQLFAFFNSAREEDIPCPTPAEAAAFEKAKAQHDAEKAQLETALRAVDQDTERKRLQQALADHAKKAPRPPDRKAMALAENPKPPVTQIHLRGDFLRKGDVVQAGTLAVLPPLEDPQPTRLDLARWLVDGKNPLTARVTVNRVWQHLFGRGLVATPDDFGVRGEKPSHSALLDYLAITFSAPREAEWESGSKGEWVKCAPTRPHAHTPTRWQGHGWSLKALIRSLVTTTTYRQSSASRPELQERDPKNVLLARQSRFRPEAEVVRDLYLSASGLLHPAIGGPSIRPPLPADIAALGYAGSVKWPETTGPERYRRGMYIFYQRTVPYPLLSTFDAPDTNTTCTRRERSNTPLQALTLLNDPVFFEAAQALGRRVVSEERTTPGRIRRAFRLCLARDPTSGELARVARLHGELLHLALADPEAVKKLAGEVPAGASAAETAAWTGVARTIMNLDEFLTRD